VKRNQGISEFPKTKNSSIFKEEMGDRRMRGLGTRNSGGLLREKKDLCEAVKRNFNPEY
jgi:hypothetical protein